MNLWKYNGWNDLRYLYNAGSTPHLRSLLEPWRPFWEDFSKLFKGVAMPHYRLPCCTSFGNVTCNINIPLLDVWYFEGSNCVSFEGLIHIWYLSSRGWGKSFPCSIYWGLNDIWVVIFWKVIHTKKYRGGSAKISPE